MCTLVAQTGGNPFCIESDWDRKKKKITVLMRFFKAIFKFMLAKDK